jgi:hypothetical protein
MTPIYSSPSPIAWKSSPSLPILLKWSLRDKKRVETIVRDFSDQNARVHEMIKLWCLASQLGVNVEHLQRLQTDDISIRLGFDKDATLRLTQWDAQNASVSLELIDTSWDQHLKPIIPVADQGLFATFEMDGRTYIQENHTYDQNLNGMGFMDTNVGSVLDARTRTRIDSLAKLLHQPKEQVFRIPPCIGWKYLPIDNSIAFIFGVQSKPADGPISLLRLLMTPDSKPGLGDKFRLALGLANCIAQLHMVKWVSGFFCQSSPMLK